MIVEIVHFDLPLGTDRAKALELFASSAAKWVTNKDLVEKYYFFSETDCRGGGVYIWTSREAAQKWHGEEYRDMVRRTYACVSHAGLHLRSPRFTMKLRPVGWCCLLRT